MKSSQIKHFLLQYLIQGRAYPAVTEGTFLGIVDVLAIKDLKYVMDFEVKVSKADLNSELDTIDFVYKGIKKSDKPMPKLSKHRLMHDAVYGNQSQMTTWWSNYNVDPRTKSPNYFCFALPDNLADYAVSRLQGTPYGVISFIEGDGYNSMRVAKKNMRIHDQDVLHSAIYRILMKGADAHYELFLQKMIKKDLTSTSTDGNL